MKTYRVHLTETETTCGDVIVQALDSKGAEENALHSSAIDWDYSESEVEVTNIVELDARSNEK